MKPLHSDLASWVRGKCIGKGSFGTVTLGVNLRDGGFFAVKSVDRNSGLPGHLEALEDEIRILRSLSSPYVLPTTSCRNLHLEYLPGGTVADVAKRWGDDVDERVVRSHAWCVVSALRYLHSRRIVHCDVKGKNILVGADINLAKLADFGSAIDTSGEASRTPILPRGSPLWMAPEVIRRELQGPESDVWSLGCTIIEMVTGKPAWEDRGVDTLSRIGFSDDLPEFPTRLSELGRDFLEKCLRRDPSKRWSCDQLLQHPFLSSSASPYTVLTDSSPRCVLDWINSEFNNEDDEEENEMSPSRGSNTENYEVSATERIGKLATTSGANWESDGWVAVRGFPCDAEAEAGVTCRGDEGEGKSTEYQYSTRAEEEYQNYGGGRSWRNENNYPECGLWCGACSLDWEAGSTTCRFGPLRCHGTRSIYSLWSVLFTLLLSSLYFTLLVVNQWLFIFLRFYSWPLFQACQCDWSICFEFMPEGKI
ncbi:hypothetical protein I3843_13G062400 [Carya illinoinensis]|nr:hypothetical protein I3843_13G062400 [Carya illinoinensis]